MQLMMNRHELIKGQRGGVSARKRYARLLARLLRGTHRLLAEHTTHTAVCAAVRRPPEGLLWCALSRNAL